MPKREKSKVPQRLLAWYDRNQRSLPWRHFGSGAPAPYGVWLSEIMLQQTTVKAVIPYYARFLRSWPSVHHLARADLDEVLSAWAGLGYYARARNLHKCARVVADELQGRFPDTEQALLALPGIGPYTAAAIAAIAFDRPATVVDGNVERVVARLFAVDTPLPGVKPELKRLAAKLSPETRPGDYAQAMMDLGATVCTPKSPSCDRCPLADCCDGLKSGTAPTLPRRIAKGQKPVRRGAAFLVERPGEQSDGEILLRKRPPKGLLASMMEIPGTAWGEAFPPRAQALETAPVSARWSKSPGVVLHTFTHFHLELHVFKAKVSRDKELRPSALPENCHWVARRDLADAALPSLMRKVIAHGEV